MSSSPSLAAAEKKHWWLSNRKIVDKYIKEARVLIATREHSEIASAINLLDAALALSPRVETALELKARSLLSLRRFKELADMLQEHIPSYKVQMEESSCSENSSQQLSRERVKLLSSDNCSSSSESDRDPSFRCFPVSDLKKKVLAGLCKNCDKDGQWRYLVLGQACCHLGLMKDAMVLLQTGRRLASAVFRRQSISLSDDSFSFPNSPLSAEISNSPPSSSSESESISHLLANIKLLLRRRAAALAALDAGLHSESIRHFSKILESRRNTPQGFLADCYIHRASAYRAAGRIAEAIADCNRTLALDPSSISALSTRAALLETIRCLPDCLRDLEHLKLLYDTILRDRKLPGPAWKRHNIRYRDVTANSRSVASKIQELRQRVARGEGCNVDYHALIGLRRGCTRSELERAHLLLCLKHRPDRSISFIDRCEFVDDQDVDTVKDQARMSALILYRLLQKGYSSVMSAIMDEEATEKQRKRAAIQASLPVQTVPQAIETDSGNKTVTRVVQEPLQNVSISGSRTVTRESQHVPNYGNKTVSKVPQAEHPSESTFPAGIELPESNNNAAAAAAASVFQGVFCRDIAVVGNLLSQAGFNRPIPVKCEALSC